MFYIYLFIITLKMKMQKVFVLDKERVSPIYFYNILTNPF